MSGHDESVGRPAVMKDVMPLTEFTVGANQSFLSAPTHTEPPTGLTERGQKSSLNNRSASHAFSIAARTT